MAKEFFKKIAERGASAARSPGIVKFFGHSLHNPNLWHLNRFSVSWAVSVGLFMAYVPVPFPNGTGGCGSHCHWLQFAYFSGISVD